MRAGSILRQIIQDRIIATVPEVAGRVYDKTSEADPFPNVTMGPSYWTAQDADCIEGRLWTCQIDVWHQGVEKGQLEDLTDAITDALRGWSDDSVIAMHGFDIALVRNMDDPDGVTFHGVIQVETLVEDYGAA